jgi:hypothetical protein
MCVIYLLLWWRLLALVFANLQQPDESSAATPAARDALSHSTVLDPGGRYHLAWRPHNNSITFRLSVATHGYIGLGFSPSGGMDGADIAVAWVTPGGAVKLLDCFAVGNRAPVPDTAQDLELDWGYENDTHTVVQFRRLWRTCDEEGDLELGPDTTRLIWAYGDADPVDENQLMYHSVLRRGTRSVHLAEPPADQTPLISAAAADTRQQVHVWDLQADRLLLPTEDHTHYWCKIFRAPPLDRKHHMIALEPLIQKGHEPYVHHMVLYECHIPAADLAGGATSADWFEHHVDQPGAPCYSPNMPAEWAFCLATNAWAWAVGSEGERLPASTGMPLGEAFGGATYFMLQIHYDNPAYHTPLVDSSGIRIYYTDAVRPTDTGMVLVGSEVNFLQFVPPGQPLFMSVGQCTSECTAAGLPASGIKIISGVLHSHLAGRRMRLRHIRRGIELPIIVEDNHYDFNFQASRIPAQETIVLPGDQLITECDYDTSGRSEPTFGGLATRDEMCMVFVLYYPRAALADCRSLPALHTLTHALGIEDVYGSAFQRLVDFMKDIGSGVGGADTSSSTIDEAGDASSSDSLSNLLKSLADETGYTVPSLPASRRPSSAPLTEEDILAQPFYTVASSEPELPAVAADGANYRTLLIELLMKLRIRAPAAFNNRTVGELLADMDWAARGPDMNQMLVKGEHNSLCLSHGRKPLIPYQPVFYPTFKPLSRAARGAKCPAAATSRRKFSALSAKSGNAGFFLPLLKSSTARLSGSSTVSLIVIVCVAQQMFS